MQSCFGCMLANPNANIRMKPELGGGALLDAGSYALSVTTPATQQARTRTA
jgi:hypothetical protein